MLPEPLDSTGKERTYGAGSSGYDTKDPHSGAGCADDKYYEAGRQRVHLDTAGSSAVILEENQKRRILDVCCLAFRTDCREPSA